MRRLLLLIALGVGQTLGGCHTGVRSNGPIAAPYRAQRVYVLDAPSALVVDVAAQRGRIDIAPVGTPLPPWVEPMSEGATDLDQSRLDDDSMLVVAIVQSEAEDRLSVVRLEPRVEGDRLMLKAAWPAARRDPNPDVSPDDGVEYVIRAPAIERVTATARWGSIRAEAVSGRVTARTSSGDVELIEQGGPVKAETAVGDIDVHLAADSTGPVDLQSRIGDVEVGVGPAFLGTIDLATTIGDVHVHGPMRSEHRTWSWIGSSARLVSGDDPSGSRSVMRTGIGDLVVRRSGESAEPD
jgi:hypothetical protein